MRISFQVSYAAVPSFLFTFTDEHGHASIHYSSSFDCTYDTRYLRTLHIFCSVFSLPSVAIRSCGGTQVIRDKTR